MAAEGANRPWDGEAESGSFGQWLRRQREVREIGLREIAETSKISLRYLEALEQDRFELLPAPVFAKGFLREYAKFVGLDPDEVVNYFISALPGDPREEERRERRPPDPQRPFLGLPLLVVLCVLLLVAVGLAYLANRRGGGPAQAPPMAPPVASAVVEPTPAAPVAEPGSSLPIQLALDFNKNSWVEAYVDGERRVSELRVQGESLRIAAAREIRLTLGNAAGVTFVLNGRPYDPHARDQQEVVIGVAEVEAIESQP